MSNFRSLALAVCLVALMTACTREQPPAAQQSAALGTARAATVNGDAVPESLFRLYAMNAHQKSVDQLTPEERDLALEDLIKLKLVADAAQERGLPNERTIAAELELQRIQLMARRMAMRYLEENPATEAEIREMYERNLPRLASAQYKAAHILLDSEAEAAAVIEQLRGGADFAALARERSTGPTASNGGDLGWFSAESVVQPVGEAVRAMEVGAFSDKPVQSRFGFHVLLLEDRREQEPPALEDVRAELVNAVDGEKIEAFVMSLMEGAVVERE